MQKKLKTFGLLLLVFALTAGVGATFTTKTVAAKKKTTATKKKVVAKTLKLKKKKATINVGQTVTLKATVKPKKAPLKWKSSKKKVATVTKKGVVKGKAAGTTTITVTSGKKKATCKVTVKQIYSIKSVQVINPKVVRVTLDKARSLKASNFSLSKKENSNAKCYRTLSVARVNNSNNTVYDLVLSTDYDSIYYDRYDGDYYSEDANEINDNDYVRVNIPTLNGAKVKETLYYKTNVPANEYISGETGDSINTAVYFNMSYKGYLSSVKVTGLPAGLTAKVHSNYVRIKGKPTAVTRGKVATMTAKDEMGKSLTQKIYFYIGSATQLVAYTKTEGRTILTNDDRTKYFSVYTVGGSGDYTYSLNNNKSDYIFIDSDGDIGFDYIYVNGAKKYIPAGNYNVSYTVTDSSNRKATGTISVTAVNGVKISGKATAADGTPIEGVTVAASFEDTNNAYYSDTLYGYSQYYEDTEEKTKTGDYSLVVYPSKSYEIVASKAGVVRGVSNYNPGNTARTLNVTLPLYKVTLSAANINMAQVDVKIYSETGSYIGSDCEEVIYLPKGTYTVDDTDYVKEGTGFSAKKVEYQFTAKFTVSRNQSVTLTATKTGYSYDYYSVDDTPLTIGEERAIDPYYDDYNDYYYTFTPSETGYYEYTCDRYQELSVYDEERNSLDYSEASADSTTKIDVELKAGTTYYFLFDYSGNVTLNKYVEPTESESEE